MTLYEAIATYCITNRLSISKFERTAGLGNGTVRKWQNGSPTLSNVEKVAVAMGIRTSTLIKRMETS